MNLNESLDVDFRPVRSRSITLPNERAREIRTTGNSVSGLMLLVADELLEDTVDPEHVQARLDRVSMYYDMFREDVEEFLREAKK